MSCQKEEELAYREEVSNITGVVMPDSLALGNEVNIKVYYVYNNGCGKFSRNDVVPGNKQFTVTSYALYPEETTCSANTPLDSTYVNFAPQQSGDFLFKFRTLSGFISDTITVF